MSDTPEPENTNLKRKLERIERLAEILKVNATKDPSKPPIQSINCDGGVSFCGTGDAILLSYISAGCPDELQIYTRDGKRDCLKYFNITLAESRFGVSGAKIFDAEVRDRGSIPRLIRACQILKIKGLPRRPEVNLPSFAIEAAKKFWGAMSPKVLFCPEVNDQSRAWCYWDELGKLVGEEKKKDLTRAIATSLAPSPSESWAIAMAVIQQCDLMIGLDSAYAHLAAVFDRQAIVILGPTRYTVFSHAPCVTCIEPPQSGRFCSGCSFAPPFGQVCAKLGCGEIRRISAQSVFVAIKEKLAERGLSL